VNGNATIKLQGMPSGGNPSCAHWWTDPSFNYWAAIDLPTDANGRLAAAGVPAFSGDLNGTAGSLSVQVAGVNGTPVSGTSGHLVSYGAGNTLADPGIVATNVTTQTSNGAANEVCTYTGANKICVPGVVTNAMMANSSTTVNGQTCTLGSTCSITSGLALPATISGTTVSGGIPYESNTTTLSSSALLCTNCLMTGGGAGGAPATGNGDFTYATHTLAGGASAIFDVHLLSASAFFLPGALSTGIVTVTTSTGAVSSEAVVPTAQGGTNTSSPAFAAQIDAATVTWAIGSALIANASLTFTVHSGSRTLNITNPVNGGSYVIWLKQDGTGGEGLTLGTGCTWKVIGGGGGAISLSSAANAVDVLAFTYDGTNCYANLGKNYN
jgi:hypothetical protein